jgi:glycosyltransferase involved in cell wall biosynthesis
MIQSKTALTAAIITFNEEENIQACLDSVADTVDEIIVLDSFSTDATERICRRHPKVKFYQHSFDDYGSQKNRAMELASSTWVLVIDADERLTPELSRSILDFLKNDPPVAGAKFPRLTPYMQREIRHGGWYPNKRYRLLKKGAAYHEGAIHEKAVLNGKGVSLKGDLLHFSYKDISDHVNTVNQFTSIAALQKHKSGKRFSLTRLLFKPAGKFIETYLIRLGLLDGIQGFVIAVISSYYSFLREAKLFELQLPGSNMPSNLPASCRRTDKSESRAPRHLPGRH